MKNTMLRKSFYHTLQITRVLFISLALLVGNALGVALAQDYECGLGVTPQKLSFHAGETGLVRSIAVVNMGNRTAAYTVYAEDDYEEWLEISPGTFSLPPDNIHKQEVVITLVLPENANGEYSTLISVAETRDAAGLSLLAGIRLPVVITTEVIMDSESNQTSQSDYHLAWMIPLPVIIIGGAVLTIQWIVKQRRTRDTSNLV